jgi:hypothetical protein
MQLPVNLDLTHIAQPILNFRVAYAPYYDGGFFIDSLKVLVSDDCGSSFKTIFRSGGEALSTTLSGNGPNNLYEYEVFSPQSCEEWRSIALDLSAFAGKYITVKFLNQSGYGNNLYLDDIALTGTNLVATQTSEMATRFRVQPNPVVGNAWVQGYSLNNEQLTLTMFNTTGQLMWRQTIGVVAGSWSLPIPMSSLLGGVYAVKINNASGRSWTEKVVKLSK